MDGVALAVEMPLSMQISAPTWKALANSSQYPQRGTGKGADKRCLGDISSDAGTTPTGQPYRGPEAHFLCCKQYKGDFPTRFLGR